MTNLEHWTFGVLGTPTDNLVLHLVVSADGTFNNFEVSY